MKQGQFRVRLRPLCGGSFTHVQLCGVVPTVAPPQLKKAMRRMAEMIAFWSGWPVVLALPVACDTGGWLDLWSDGLQQIPERHLELRYILRRSARRADAGARHER